MAEYIDRDALLQGIEQVRRTSKNSFPRQHFVVGDVLTCIRTAPAAEVFEVMHGKWVKKWDLYDKGFFIARKFWWECSCCGMKTDWKDEFVDKEVGYNYCPNCGALMMEVEHDKYPSDPV